MHTRIPGAYGVAGGRVGGERTALADDAYRDLGARIVAISDPRREEIADNGFETEVF
jgi:hypothetical protein